jgi:hypothetical protein
VFFFAPSRHGFIIKEKINMTQSFGCYCGERLKPLSERNWVVCQYLSNHSAFNGYHRTASDYSSVVCRTDGCHGAGRTKAGYISELWALQGKREADPHGWRVPRDLTEPDWWKIKWEAG